MKYYTSNGKEYKGTPWQGNYYDKTGKVRYTFKSGKLSDVATTDSFLSSISPSFAKYTSITKNKSNTKVNTGGKEYDVYSANGAYFYKSGNNYIPITDTNVIKGLKQNNKTSISLDKNVSSAGGGTGATGSGSGGGGIRGTNTTTTTTTTPTYTGGGSGYSTPDVYSQISDLQAANNELLEKIYELEHPKVMSADEAAKHFGIDYNYDNILSDYNDQTNSYYKNLIDEQQDLRTQYLRNNTQYYDSLIDDYIDSYANAAPTAIGQGVLAANALTTQLNANKTNASNDYGMLQSVNNLEQARDAELAGNPYLAKQYYNNLGTYLSTLTANKNTYDVKQYVDQLDAYSDMYSSSRATQASLAQANAAKYSGLANASIANAKTNADSTSNLQQLYDFYNKALGNSTLASKYVNNLIGSSFNAGVGK